MTSQSTLPFLFAVKAPVRLKVLRVLTRMCQNHTFPTLNPPTPTTGELHIKYYFLLSMTTPPWQLTSKTNTWGAQKALELGRRNKPR